MTEQSTPNNGVWRSRAKLAFAVFAIIGAFLLIAEHRAHVLPYLPWLLLAACPLMHLFMHGGHGGHEGHHGRGGRNAPDAGSGGPPASKPEGARGSGVGPHGEDHAHHEGRP